MPGGPSPEPGRPSTQWIQTRRHTGSQWYTFLVVVMHAKQNSAWRGFMTIPAKPPHTTEVFMALSPCAFQKPIFTAQYTGHVILTLQSSELPMIRPARKHQVIGLQIPGKAPMHVVRYTQDEKRRSVACRTLFQGVLEQPTLSPILQSKPSDPM